MGRGLDSVIDEGWMHLDYVDASGDDIDVTVFSRRQGAKGRFSLSMELR